MARGEKGSPFDGFHGRINDMFVIKQRNGKPVLCFYPKGRKVKWTENQKNYRQEFKWATRYASHALKIPEKLKFYQEREREGVNAYNLAVADYILKPAITSIRIRKSRWPEQYLVQVVATDEFIITGVQVQLFDLAGKNIDRADATRFRHTDRWLYRVNSEKLSTVARIRAFAWDYTGHTAEMDYLVTPEEALKWLPHSHT